MRFSLHHERFALTTQLILAFLTVSLIPLALLAFLNEQEMRAVLTDDANRSLAAAAEQTAAGIDAFIRDNLDAARREALLPTFVRYLSLPVVEREGSSEEEAVVATLNQLRRRDKVFISTYALLDRQGQNVLDTNPENMGRNESVHDYFQKPLETGLPYLSAPRFEHQSENQAASFHEAVLYFSAPVYLEQKTIGVLRVGYQASILQQLVVKNNGLAGEQSFAILFDQNQVRLAHGTAPELIFKSVVPLEPKLLIRLQAEGRLPNSPLSELSTHLPSLAEGLDNLLFQANFTAPLEATGEGLNLAIGQELETQPWVVLFMQPQQVFLAPIEAQTKATLFLAIVIGGLVVGSAFVVARVLAQPIVQLTETVTQFTAGDLEARTEIKRADELGQLADTFNAMAEQLKEGFATLQASENKYRTLFEESRDMIYISTLDGRLIDVNPAGQTLLGYPREALLEMSTLTFYANPLDRIRFQQEIASEGSVKDFEVQLVRQDGRKIECLLTASLRQAEDGISSGYQGIIRDISQRKQHEKLLQEYNRTLEEEVSARTAQLAEATRQAELAQANAEAANRAKSIFLANMSHELRTPLNAILGFAQVMSRSQTLPPEQLENLAIIERGGENLLTLINNLLDLSKMEVGKMSLNQRSLDLYRLLDELEDIFSLLAEEKGLQLIFERTSDVPQYVCTDSVKLRKVLINLVGNALKFTAQGRVSVRVAPLGALNGATAVSFSVSDTGVGIASDELNQLFEAFVQTEGGKKAQQGAGLGLPISYQFVRLMGGEMSVDTQVGCGTSFKFCIQVAQVDARQIKKAQPTRRVMSLEPNQPGYRILIVDDRKENRLLLISLLNPLGFSLKEASNGQEAYDLWDSWSPHLIWMDMRMPVMDGYEASKRIKSTTKGQATAIIALTASTLEEEQAVILSAGCDDFLRKPFRESDIFDLMHKHIGVRYIYDENQDQNQASSGATVAQQPLLTPAALAALPTSLLLPLQVAVGGSDIEMMEQVFAQISLLDPALANQLTRLADDFEYDEILQLLEEAKVVDLLG